VPLIVIQRQLGHTNLGITSIYLQRIAPHHPITPHPRLDEGPGSDKQQRRSDERQSAGRCAAQRSRGHDRAAV
jgi:hypothetical protein